MWKRCRHRLRAHLGIVAEEGGDRWAAAIGRQVPQFRNSGDLFQERDREMGRSVQAAGTVNDRLRPLLGVVEQVLERLVRLLVIDEHQDGIGHQSGQRDEIGAGGFGLSSEKLVDFFVTGNSVVVRQQRVTIGLRAGADLCADLASGTRFGFDDNRLFDHRFKRGGERPGDDVIHATRGECIDDRDRMRRKGLLCEHRAARHEGGRADNEATAIHHVPPKSREANCRLRQL